MAVEIINSDSGSGGGGKVLIGFILGAVLLAVAVVAFFMWDNFKSGGHPSAPAAIHVTVKGK
ncbi:MAG TPA: hypothetical protein VII56_15345 [Rhizomicrobium sp.]